MGYNIPITTEEPVGIVLLEQKNNKHKKKWEENVMRKHKFLKAAAVLSMATVMTVGMASTAFAYGEWQSNEKGTWWQNTIAECFTYGEGSYQYPKNRWLWVDDDGNGTAECYYFNGEGYRVENTTTPDGYQVDEKGRWIVNGTVQTCATDLDAGHVADDSYLDNRFAAKGKPVSDPNAIARITQNHELTDQLWTENGASNPLLANPIKEPSVSRIDPENTTYTISYRGKPLECDIYPSGKLGIFYGTAGQLFDGIPETGITLEAFKANTGYGGSCEATTGNSDAVFGLPIASYRYSYGMTRNSNFCILLTEGPKSSEHLVTRPDWWKTPGQVYDNENHEPVVRDWYIFPDSKVEIWGSDNSQETIEYFDLQP